MYSRRHAELVQPGRPPRLGVGAQGPTLVVVRRGAPEARPWPGIDHLLVVDPEE